jgi:hypothetical protein
LLGGLVGFLSGLGPYTREAAQSGTVSAAYRRLMPALMFVLTFMLDLSSVFVGIVFLRWPVLPAFTP